MPWAMPSAVIGTARAAMKPGRNEPCPCGTGRKFKHCCGQEAPPAAAPVGAPAAAELAALVQLLHQGRLRDSEARAQELLRSHPEAGLAWKVLSVARLRQGGLEDALPALERAAQLLPEDHEA